MEKNEIYRLRSNKKAAIETQLMHRPDDRVNRFVCKADLLSPSYWDDEALGKIFHFWQESQFERFRQEHAVTLSILAFIEWPMENDLKAFRELFTVFLISAWPDDRLLPLTDHSHRLYIWLEQNGSKAYAEAFMNDQYIFSPFLIKEADEGGIVRVDASCRLPFDEEPEYVGGGAFGEVYKAKVARHCYSDSPGMSNNEPMVLAFKKYSNREDCKSEEARFQILRKSIAQHSCIASHLAAIARGSDFYIFLPHTELGDLQTLMNGGYEYKQIDEKEFDWVPRYDFEEQFRRPSRSHFVEQLKNIANALDHLHFRLPDISKENVYCAHMDLKPDNILVYPANDPSKPNVGKWVLTDFGISSFKEVEKNERHHYLRTVEEFFRLPHKDKMGTGRLGNGTHRAPEMDESFSLTRKNPIHCDIWSFGCIVNEIFAFILPGFEDGFKKGKESLQHFQDQKKVTPTGEGFGDDYWFEKDHSESGSHSKVKDCIVNWLDGPARHRLHENLAPHHPRHPRWLPSMKDLVQNVLKIKPESRPSAREIQHHLADILEDLLEFEKPPVPQDQEPVSRSITSGSATLNSGDDVSTTSTRTSSFLKDVKITFPEQDRASVLSEGKKMVKDFDISPDAAVGGWLVSNSSGYEALVYSTDAKAGQEPLLTVSDLEPKVKWNNIRLTNKHVIVTGQRGTNKEGRIRDLQTNDEIAIPGGWMGRMKVTPSAQGYFAWQTVEGRKTVNIWNGENEKIISRPVDHGTGINCMDFSADGRYLYVWTSGGGRNFINMMSTSDGDISHPLELSLPMKRVSHRQHSFWMTQNIPACVLQEAQGHDRWFLSFKRTSEDKRVDRLKVIQSDPKDDGSWQFALANDSLVMARRVRRPKLGSSRIKVARKQLDFDDDSSLKADGYTDVDTRVVKGHRFKVAVHQGDQCETIAIVTNVGEVLRYLIKPKDR